ncbi:MAG: HEAT repeat domain-containing protein [Terriglobia bacterium]
MVQIIASCAHLTCSRKGKGRIAAKAALIVFVTTCISAYIVARPQQRTANAVLYSAGKKINKSAAVRAQDVGKWLAALNDPDSRVRRRAAEVLGEVHNCREFKEDRVISALMAALSKHDAPVVAGAYLFFIFQGEPGSEHELIRVLNKLGDERMAIAFLISGNRKLENAASKWGVRHGYLTTGTASLALWGCNR